MFDAESPVPIIRDKSTPIANSELYPHYSDRRFILPTRNRTIFLAAGAVLLEGSDFDRVEGIDSYEHSRLVLAGQNEAWDAVRNECGGRDDAYERTAAFFEAMIGKVLDRPLEIKHILAGVEVMGTGNPYQDFGVKYL